MTDTAIATPQFANDLSPHPQRVDDAEALRQINSHLLAALNALQRAAPEPLRDEIGQRLCAEVLFVELRVRAETGLVATVRLPTGKVELGQRA